MTVTENPLGPIVVDLSTMQSPVTRGRGIARYALSWALALEAVRPDLVSKYLLNPTLNPPATLEGLLGTGKVDYATPARFSSHVRLLHVLSALDTTVPASMLWPDVARSRGFLLSATVYDLIPALNLETELIEPIDRRRYRTHLEFVRMLDHVQVLSESVGNDIEMLLRIDKSKIDVIGAAPSARFRPPASEEEAAQHLTASFPELGASPFVLYPSGNHPRKNNEALVTAWSLLPHDLRYGYQLVISGNLPPSTRHHLAVLAETLGIGNQVVTTGEVDDADLVTLYQAANLMCFPSLSEGYGLPVIEAIACGTPVIASNRAPLDELIDDVVRFNPTTPKHIADAIAGALTDNVVARALARQQHTPLATWEDVALKSAAGFDRVLASRPLRAGHRRAAKKPRLAFVTPLPPAPTGVAAYSYRVLEELIATDEMRIDVYVENPTEHDAIPSGVTVHNVAALPAIERLQGAYDHVVYTLGNSHHHLGALSMLRNRPGVVLSHDIRLTNLYRHENGDPGLLLGGFQRALHAMYGNALPASLGNDGVISQYDVDRFGTFMAREVVRRSTAFLVTSDAAATLARLDAGQGYRDRIGVLPFAVEAPQEKKERSFSDQATPADETDVEEFLEGLPNDLHSVPFVVHFGIVDPAKNPAQLIEAFSKISDLRIAPLLVFAGPVADDLAAEMQLVAEQFGVADRFVMTGALTTKNYRKWLSLTTVAVQLRQSFNGEASAAVGECLACGVPTIVSDVGWFHELPNNAVEKIAHPLDVGDLAGAIHDLIENNDRRDELTENAKAFANRHSFAVTARNLLDYLVFGRPQDRDARTYNDLGF